MKPKHTKNDPWARLDAMFAADKEPTGPEWFTTAEFRARYELAEQQARKRLEKLKRAGTIEQWVGHSKTERHRISKYRFAN